MRNFIGMEHLIDRDFAKRTGHRLHAPGCEKSADMYGPMAEARRLRETYTARQPWGSQVDLAWVVCLFECGAIDRERAAKLVAAIRQTWEVSKGSSGEDSLVEVLGGDMDLASTVNYGRTLQEPMSRLRLRGMMLDVVDTIVALLETVHRLAAENLDTIMIGHTHMNHAQPITYAHFMVAAFDGVMRSLEQFELAYRYTNQNSGGCGSCSGTVWPVDRERMAALLGMDGVVEPTYDCEASQDHSFALMFALSNLGMHLSRYAMNHYIWAFDEFDMIRTHPAMCGVSSFMPQKCDSGSNYERVRIAGANIMGSTVTAMFQLKGEPHGDVLPAAIDVPAQAIESMVHAHLGAKLFDNMLKHTFLQKERMLKIVKAGFSCATELAAYLIREEGYGGRLAHSIVATLVRDAREKGLKSTDLTGEMLDEAAAFLDVRKPGLDTKTVQKCFDPEEFVKTHKHIGGVAPEENARLLKKRRVQLDEAIARQKDRRGRVREGLGMLEREGDGLMEG